jgi:MacB-like periplasmic core domain
MTADIWPILGAQPALGRVFTEEEDRDGAAGTVVLSYGLWQDLFAGNGEALGSKVSLDGAPYSVIGVMPRGFYSGSGDSPVDGDALRAAGFSIAKTRTYMELDCGSRASR